MIEPLLQHDSELAPRRRHDVLLTGIYTGALLVIVMLAALVAANRVPGLERYALERNAASYSLFVLFMTIPVLRYWSRPLKMFGAAIIGWVLFAVAFDVSGMVFHDLFDSVRHDPLMALVEGTAVYGICAVVSWVGEMVLHARKHPIGPGRKSISESTRYRR